MTTVQMDAMAKTLSLDRSKYANDEAFIDAAVHLIEAGPPTQLPLSPTTTAQEDVTTAGQRQVNLIWERTQAAIAMGVVLTCMVTSAWGYIGKSQEQVPNILAAAFGTVVGFYFSRTNHAAIGGVGAQPRPEKYTGR